MRIVQRKAEKGTRNRQKVSASPEHAQAKRQKSLHLKPAKGLNQNGNRCSPTSSAEGREKTLPRVN